MYISELEYRNVYNLQPQPFMLEIDLFSDLCRGFFAQLGIIHIHCLVNVDTGRPKLVKRFSSGERST